MRSDVQSSPSRSRPSISTRRMSLERPSAPPPRGAAAAVAPLLAYLFNKELPVRFEFWDGTALGPIDRRAAVLVRSPNAMRRILWAPRELGLARAFVMGDLQFEGDIHEVLELMHRAAPADIRTGPIARLSFLALTTARRLGVLGPPLPPPPEEASPHGRRHSKHRDAEVISHHYDVSNAFYRMVLGPSMTYSCAQFETDASTLGEAQESKLDLVCRKLGLPARPGVRVLDVGCGWGSMALHAAGHYGARVVGVTLSREQAELARERVAHAGLHGQIEIRMQDYRDIRDEPFDAISSVGMFEHVGSSHMGEYFATMRRLLAPEGRLLNHAISSVGGSRIGHNSFIGRYVFPDGELIDVGTVVLAMERAGFEVRDLESLREHYARTLRAWVRNLEDNWELAVAEVGERRGGSGTSTWRCQPTHSTRGGYPSTRSLASLPVWRGRAGCPSRERRGRRGQSGYGNRRTERTCRTGVAAPPSTSDCHRRCWVGSPPASPT